MSVASRTPAAAPVAGEPTGLEEALRRARAAAFGPAEDVGQESFVGRSEVLTLARAAGVGPGSAVLDLCCGSGGPGLLLAARLGCDYRGVDRSPAAVERARARAGAESITCRIEVGQVPLLGSGPVDVVLLLETLLAFPDKRALVESVVDALVPGGRFAVTLEAGHPLTPVERAAMPRSETVWLTPLDVFVDELDRAGLDVRWHREWTTPHRLRADALAVAYEDVARAVHAVEQRAAVDRLVAAHRLWSGWLHDGRVRKYALVAERRHGTRRGMPSASTPRLSGLTLMRP